MPGWSLELVRCGALGHKRRAGLGCKWPHLSWGRQAGLPGTGGKRGWGLSPPTALISCSEMRGEVTAECRGRKRRETWGWGEE